MDDRTGTWAAAKIVIAGLGFLVVVLSARAAFGLVGVQVVLLATMVVVATLAWMSLTDRPLPRLSLLRGAAPAAEPVVEDAWRSERWIADAVERGLRALEEWRMEQREA